MKIFLSITLLIFLMTNLISDENSTIELNTTIEDSNLSALSEDELIAEFMKVDEEVENLKKLGKTVDELANKLGIEE